MRDLRALLTVYRRSLVHRLKESRERDSLVTILLGVASGLFWLFVLGLIYLLLSLFFDYQPGGTGGLGIAALPDYMSHESTNLVEVLPELGGPSYDAFFVYPEELRHSERINVFRDYLVRKVVEAGVPLHPADIGVLGPLAAIPAPDLRAQLIEQFGPRHDGSIRAFLNRRSTGGRAEYWPDPRPWVRYSPSKLSPLNMEDRKSCKH